MNGPTKRFDRKISADVKYSNISRMISIGKSLNDVMTRKWFQSSIVFEIFRIISETSIERRRTGCNDTPNKRNHWMVDLIIWSKFVRF